MTEPRDMLGLIPHGLYLIGIQTEASRFIYTGSWLTQISSNRVSSPPPCARRMRATN